MKICSQEVNGCMFGVVFIQIITWIVVSALLFYRGIGNLWNGQSLYYGNLTLVNRTAESHAFEPPAIKGYSAGIVILVIASTMMIIGPVFLIVVIIENCFRKRRFSKLPQEDLPPKYEDVVMEELAPRYSTLFLNVDIEENNQT